MQVNIAGNLVQCHSRFTACSALASDANIISDLHPWETIGVSIAIPRLYILYSYYETVFQQTYDAVQNADHLCIHKTSLYLITLIMYVTFQYLSHYL